MWMHRRQQGSAVQIHTDNNTNRFGLVVNVKFCFTFFIWPSGEQNHKYPI